MIDRDVVLGIVGDWSEPATEAIPDIRRFFPENRICYTMGNHDFYSDHRKPELKTTWEWQRDNAPKVAALHDVHLLDGGYSNGEVIIEDTRIFGATLWTDFNGRPGYVMWGDAVRRARIMNDYRLIKIGRGRSHDLFEPKHSIADHHRARKWLETSLATPFEGETVVMTHHAPSYKSLEHGKPYNDLDWCYASDLEYLMHPYDRNENPHNLAATHAPCTLWLHGHIHACRDHIVGNTRVVANPRGYPAGHWYTWREGGPRENPSFDENLVIKVGGPLTPGMGM